MEDLVTFRAAIRSVIEHHGQFKPSYGDIETEMVFDEVNDHYELVRVGWYQDGRGLERRIHGAVIHLDIRDGKVYVQHDGTSGDGGVVDELIEAGVPQHKIVLAFKSPSHRVHTPGFAMA